MNFPFKIIDLVYIVKDELKCFDFIIYYLFSSEEIFESDITMIENLKLIRFLSKTFSIH